MICDQLIWDYRAGYVICRDTGEVVDRIYDYGPVYEKPETIERRRVEQRRRKRRNRSIDDVRSRLRRYLGLLRLAKSITSRGYVIVDYNKLLESSKFVFTVYSRRSLKALEWFKAKHLLPVLDKIIDVVSDLEPRAMARTVRGRYILAYIVYEMIQGRDLSYRQLDGLRHLISFNSFKKLRREARKIVMKHALILKEVIKSGSPDHRRG